MRYTDDIQGVDMSALYDVDLCIYSHVSIRCTFKIILGRPCLISSSIGGQPVDVLLISAVDMVTGKTLEKRLEDIEAKRLAELAAQEEKRK